MNTMIPEDIDAVTNMYIYTCIEHSSLVETASLLTWVLIFDTNPQHHLRPETTVIQHAKCHKIRTPQ